MIVKRKDGYFILSEKTKRNLGGPHKTKEEAKKDFARSNTSNTLKRTKNQ